MTQHGVDSFPRSWSATLLSSAPLIAPARQFVYPFRVAGEEDAMSRGAIQVEVKPLKGGTFLATGALGFRDPSLPTGIRSCPRAEDMLLLAGGYAYLIDTLEPERCHHLPVRPVTGIFPAPEQELLILAGFHHLMAVGVNGPAWESARLSWEGISLDGIEGGRLCGTGWDMKADRELPFSVDLRSGEHSGGAFNLP